MLARDLMRKEVFTIGADEPVAELIDVLVREHIHGVPVLDGDGRLAGVVTQQDIFFATITLGRGKDAGGGSKDDKAGLGPGLKVRDIMTSPAVSADEDTDAISLCRMMARLRIHRVPIVRDEKVTGIISSLDICGALARGDLRA